MKKPIPSPLILIATTGCALIALASTALSEPPGRGAERRGEATDRRAFSLPAPLRYQSEGLRQEWDGVRHRVRSEFEEARKNIRRDSASVRAEIEARRGGFRFTNVLDSIFGRPGGHADVPNDAWIPEPSRQRARNDDFRYGYREQRRSAVPRDIREQWHREDAWANEFENVQEQRQAPAAKNQGQSWDRTPPAPATKVASDRKEPAATSKTKTRRPAARPARAATKRVSPPASLPEPVETPPAKKPKTKQSRSSLLQPPVDTPPATEKKTQASVENVIGSSSSTPPAPKKKKSASYPYGLPVPGKPGMIYSPHVDDSAKYVDVRNIPAGTLVKDPYSGKFFRVP